MNKFRDVDELILPSSSRQSDSIADLKSRLTRRLGGSGRSLHSEERKE